MEDINFLLYIVRESLEMNFLMNTILIFQNNKILFGKNLRDIFNLNLFLSKIKKNFRLHENEKVNSRLI